ncbi:caffeine-induced death protein 2-domain-containing protein [Cladochytrium replicatum]|nr:caffeine-induced death protein 2-domain-containing protein [Cladochytrium replicatum]
MSISSHIFMSIGMNSGDASCLELSFFKATLKEARILDDNMTPKLNALTTRSTDLDRSCSSFLEQLKVAYASRDRFINRCVKVMRNEVSQRKEALASDPNSRSTKASILVAEAQLRAMENEFTVEEILRDRTWSLFHSRCRGLKIPDLKPARDPA